MKNFEENMKALGISFERWEAVNGKDVGMSQSNVICRNYTCTNGMIGCYMSHIALWRHLLQRNASGWFLVCEDDSLLTKEAIKNISSMFSEMRAWPANHPYPEMINLSCTALCKYKRITKSIFLPLSVNGTACYLISVNGIKNALSILDRPIITHIDNTLLINLLIGKNLSYYATYNFIKNSDGFQSTVSTGSFPRLEADILNSLLGIFLQNNHLHIIYESTFVGNNRITFNGLVIWFSFVTSAMLALGMYDLAIAYCLIEVFYWYFRKLGPQAC